MSSIVLFFLVLIYSWILSRLFKCRSFYLSSGRNGGRRSWACSKNTRVMNFAMLVALLYVYSWGNADNKLLGSSITNYRWFEKTWVWVAVVCSSGVSLSSSISMSQSDMLLTWQRIGSSSRYCLGELPFLSLSFEVVNWRRSSSSSSDSKLQENRYLSNGSKRIGLSLNSCYDASNAFSISAKIASPLLKSYVLLIPNIKYMIEKVTYSL